ncbi:hypothetical protein Saro_0640 [Novosphingobium aromaticivorans DSM 12444]|uniref:Uncharacterized protein n=1 Tax=Novosphingobium aromaticivorans (strain ATCC 700278 / DSM 12444 / CCUG 56034 / CIP 105152 / NBRC 16084 / F199) TaxID=279238 RepID=Q2GAN6_NOVAD|nr:hypothetical protein [Novosphingobium aromaticivorans]ABD25087.1 hypothetical protein Saro_0640 [Novosphingobium aromaticivorans DSM 12444]SCY96008.1 hypothetical protein SAMN05660666_03895 [Novosphingobium aromaticivorans]
MSVQSDIGPARGGVPRWKTYAQAREIAALAQLAMECAADTPRADLPRALAQFDRIRAILGTQSAE